MYIGAQNAYYWSNVMHINVKMRISAQVTKKYHIRAENTPKYGEKLIKYVYNTRVRNYIYKSNVMYIDVKT